MKALKSKIMAPTLAVGIGLASMLMPSASYAAVLDVPLFSQNPELKNGCEVTSLSMLLASQGIQVSKMILANQVQKDPTPYRKVGNTIYWGNPNTGFVGDITGASIGYSVYHGPIYRLANQYMNAVDLTGHSFDDILKQLDRGKPVWVITTSTFDTVPSYQWEIIQTPLGPLSITFHEHSVLLTGYDSNSVYFNDPLANIKNRRVSRSAFVRGWEQFGRQAITYGVAKGVMDNPASNAVISDSYNVSGWFLDDSGVAKVEVLVDGAVAGEASYGDARPDVQNAYPEYNNRNAGYHYALDTTRLKNGTHHIAVREIGTNGKTMTLPEGTVTVSNVKGMLDTPASGATLSGSTNVSGWFLDGSGVSKVEVLVDGAVAGQAAYGDARPDVQKAYPEYQNGTSGYHYTLDTTKFTDGSHRITVRETGISGKVKTLPEGTVTFSNARGVLDTPVSGAKLSGSANVSGWFLDKGGVSKVEVLVDGAAAGQAVYGDARPDVQKAYPEYQNGTSGYHYTLDTTKFSNGSHSITIRGTRANGQVTTLPGGTVIISNLDIKGVLDTPVSGATLSGSTNVSGWLLDPSGVSKLEILVDGAVAGQAVYGDARPDVQNVYPAYKNGTSGYHYALDTTKFSNGSHSITIRETRMNGQVVTLPGGTVTISNLDVKEVLDTPASGATLSGSTNVSGWLLDPSGVSKIEIVVDGAVAGRAVYGDARPDVQNVYPAYKNGTSGYHYTLDTTKFSNGSHNITIREIRMNGQMATLPGGTVTISNLNSKGALDTPVSGATLSASTNISGWFLDPSGVSKVEILIDGAVAGQAVYGDARLDVQKVYPAYKNGKSGYHYTLDTTKFSNGNHRMVVRETGKNGKVTTLPEQVVTISNAKS